MITVYTFNNPAYVVRIVIDAKELKLKTNHNSDGSYQIKTGDAKELKLKANHNYCHCIHTVGIDAKELKLKANHNTIHTDSFQ